MRCLKLYLYLSIITLLISCGNKTNLEEGHYLVRGDIEGLPKDSLMIYMTHSDSFGKEHRTDSAMIVDGKFTFEGEIEGIQPFILGMNMVEDGVVLHSKIFKTGFILSPGILNIKGTLGSLDSLKVDGTKAQEDYNRFIKEGEVYNKKIYSVLDQLYDIGKDDLQKRSDLDFELAERRKEYQNFVKSYVQNNSDDEVSSYLAYSTLKGASPEFQKRVFALLSSKNQNARFGKAMSKEITLKSGTLVGQKAPAIILPDTSGNLIEMGFYSYYTLIDFWASWCGPCREENPNLIYLYNKYKNRKIINVPKFQIIGISGDRDSKAWKKAIKEDGLPWLQLSDLMGKDSPVTKEFGVTTLPMNFLVNKNGEIVARNVHGAELRKLLEKLLPE